MGIKGYSYTVKEFLKNIYQKGFFHLLSARGLTKILSFGSQLILAWIFIPEDLGRIKTLQSFLGVISVLAIGGFNASTLKICSENRSMKEKVFFFRNAMKYALVTSVVLYIVFAAITKTGLFSEDIKINQLLWIIAVAIIPRALNEVYLSYFQSLKMLKSYAYIQALTKFVALFLLIILSYFFKLQGYALAIILSAILTFISLSVFDRIKLKTRKYYEKIKDKPLKQHLQYSPYSWMANFTSILRTNIDILLLNFLSVSTAIIGFYAFAKIFINALRIAAQTVQLSTNPYFSKLADKPHQFLAKYRKYNRIMIITSILGTILLLAVVPLFMKYAMNGEYAESIPFFIVLVLGWLIRSNNTIRASALFGLGRINYNLYVSSAGLLVSILTAFGLYRIMGPIGVAYGMLIGNVVLFVVSLIMFRKSKSRFLTRDNL